MDAFQYLLSLEKFGIKFGLSNIQTLIEALGHPESAFKSILIAGTNGKGSVTAMVDLALRSQGLKVGRYTSPHLVDLEERFAINGRPVERSSLENVTVELRGLIDGLLTRGALEAPPTFFEVTTAIGFELFRRARVEVAVLEVGLGGRLDSTNVVDPVAAAITSIDFDHQQYLGNTLAAIAAEKAGVIRPGIPVVIGTLHDDARTVVVAACQAAGADLVEADQSTQLKIRRESGGLLLHVTTPMRSYGWIRLGLRGDHQAANAVVAVRLLESLAQVIPISADAIVAGLRDVRWPGRLQMLEVPGGRRVLLDAAHNPAGAWALASYLKREFPEPLPLVFAAMQDKDVALMLKTLLPVVSRCIMTEPATPRAHRSADLATVARRLSTSATIEVEPDPQAALESAWRSCPLACAAGSIFLIGEILAGLGSSARDL